MRNRELEGFLRPPTAHVVPYDDARERGGVCHCAVHDRRRLDCRRPIPRPSLAKLAQAGDIKGALLPCRSMFDRTGELASTVNQ